MKRVLFVDDEPNVLQGLQRMLRPMRDEWIMEFAQSGQEALELLDQEPFDVVVSDMRMPGMSGAQLLCEIMQRHPQVVRIILSGQSDQKDILQSIGRTHQYLSKPCDAETLKSTIVRACGLRELLMSDPLKEVVSQITSLPSLPSLYTTIVEELNSPASSLREIGEIIEQDAGMTVKILQLVNSAFFGLARKVSSPAQAIGLIGLETLKALVLSHHVFTQFEQAGSSQFALDELWRHTLLVGAFARRIAREERCERNLIDDAFTAGLLHDVGRLVLAANVSTAYEEILRRACENGMTVEKAELETLGASHAEVGAYLMGLWGLPDTIVEAVAFHHHPSKRICSEFGPLTAVHVADALEHALHSGEGVGRALPVDADYLEELGLTGRLETWRTMSEHMVQEGEAGGGI